MDQSTHIEPARIDDLLAAYRELHAQFDRVRERLRRAEENRHTVQRRIFDRVHDEYNRELDSLRARMSPLRDELDRVYESLEAQCRETTSVIQAVEDELAEAEFRHRTGEYESTAFADLRQTLGDRAEEARTCHALLQATLTAIEAMRRPDVKDHAAPAAAPVADAPEPVVAEAPPTIVVPSGPPAEVPAVTLDDAPTLVLDEPVVEEPAAIEAPLVEQPAFEAPLVEEPAFEAPVVADPASEETPATVAAAEPVLEEAHRPVLNARSVAAAGRGDGFENPHDWISEMGPESARSERRARLAVPAPSPAPARAAAAVDELDAALKPVSTPVADYPSLVFVSGAHAGQSIALLPTTLTIGREHDNNIEIKDPDVARYHARILRDCEHYVVEDLNSSTGTWVNGERTQRAVLGHGDVIRVGQTELALDFEWTHGLSR